MHDGAIAQLGERLHGMQEVSGSIPLSSTKFYPHFLGFLILFLIHIYAFHVVTSVAHISITLISLLCFHCSGFYCFGFYGVKRQIYYSTLAYQRMHVKHEC